MAYFPAPADRLQSLSVYVARCKVIGTQAVVLQMVRDGKPLSDARAVLRLAQTH